MLHRFKQLGTQLVQKHGAEVSGIAKIAAHALIPGAPMIVTAVELICDYASEKNQELADEKLSEIVQGIGKDVQYLESLMSHLTGELSAVLEMMMQSAQFGTPPQVLEAMINSALEGQFRSLRDEIRSLTPELDIIQRQQESMLRKQSLQGDMLRQVQDQLCAALSYHEPLVNEGIITHHESVEVDIGEVMRTIAVSLIVVIVVLMVLGTVLVSD